MKKLDFQSTLALQIIDLEKQIASFEEEIRVRKNAESIRDAGGYQSWTPVDFAVNKRIITELESALVSKKDWMDKLKAEQKLDDAAMLEKYDKLQENLVSVLAKGEKLKDPHDKNQFNYLKETLSLWMADTEHPGYKEASVYYFSSIEELLKFAGIN